MKIGQYFKKIFDGNARDIKNQKVVDEIGVLEPAMKALTDTELQNKTVEFKTGFGKRDTIELTCWCLLLL